ncbi:hypothetical protein EV659_102403 [Rhodothalassium salexigens DSM 2132]|uniref:Aminoglycoside phosphotransferase domain-containing protein n=1 Tax=Rhodothalassium salexigens DSM 2132 TaxID=1188247 RepID=A0A4R2PQC3_RHOSA|nr:bifunctional aminoglycoside phosphotransferase/ATP-binding protein [Rhodothalassium salexigens]MBB4210451.1 hypothetical protein [Rhodothalassium salexigens DSM 2132]MBK1638225.1 hypothetical protein [Rhodothalassium salexigens DSM 2132]TCP37992.1 hypothetical protein EV659_102403 [Rhodothalassium salexigens DSM 2132]
MTQTDDQSRAIAFLSDPATHGLDGAHARVERIDTHMSHIFLTPDRAYKLMRAVRYPMIVDFSARAARQAACAAEIKVNRAMAGPLYRGVRALTEAPGGGLAWDGDGAAVDHVVEMARFDEATRFDRLAEAGGLERWMLDQIADLAAAAHGAAPVRFHAFGAAELDGLLAELTRNLRGEAAPALDGQKVERYLSALGEAVAAARPVADYRRAAGHVVRAHGDLHLANMCLYDGRAMPFDAVVFNDAFSDIDALYDLAFAVMDLIRVGRRDLAAAMTARYMTARRDYAGLGVWPLYLSLRAAIRAMVTAMAPDSPDRSPRAGRFLDLALDLVAQRPAPRLVAVGGRSGTGKSTLAASLAPHLGGAAGAVVIKSDEIRKRLYGITPEDRLPDEAYAAPVSARVYDRLIHDAQSALAAGATVIADATFLKAEGRDRLAEAAGRLGVAFTGLMLEAGTDTLGRRLDARTHDVSDADTAVLALQRLEGPCGWHRLDSDQPLDRSTQAALDRVRATPAPD